MLQEQLWPLGLGSPPAPGCSRHSVAAFLACSLPRTQFNGRKALQRVRGVGNVYCLASETLESNTGKAQSQSCPGCSAEPDLQPKGSEERGRGKATACKHATKKTLPFTAWNPAAVAVLAKGTGDASARARRALPETKEGWPETWVMAGACGSP